MHLDDMLADSGINGWLAIIQNDEKQVESRHDRGRNLDVVFLSTMERSYCSSKEDATAKLTNGLVTS